MEHKVVIQFYVEAETENDAQQIAREISNLVYRMDGYDSTILEVKE